MGTLLGIIPCQGIFFNLKNRSETRDLASEGQTETLGSHGTLFSHRAITPDLMLLLHCADIDECADTCPSNSSCTNTLGSYFCTCHPGFASSNGQLDFTDPEVTCEGERDFPDGLGCTCLHGPRNFFIYLIFIPDIDECSQDPLQCGLNSICTNVPGSYVCGCLPDFQMDPEGSQAHGNFNCKSNDLVHWQGELCFCFAQSFFPSN